MAESEASSSTRQMITITLSHRGTSHTFTVSPISTLRDLQLDIENKTSVPPEFQKLLYKGKKGVSDSESAPLESVGLKNGTKVTLMGSTLEEIRGMKSAENEKGRRDDIIKRRAEKGPSKVRTTASSSSATLNYRFHKIEPLAHLPNPQSALALLQKLASDPAVRHVMVEHQFSVGVLTELAPHEHPNLLGLNVNAGQSIKLRLRTDEYDGMRIYNEVRRVLLHELTHNVWGDHDDRFKALNSRLNREVAAFELEAKNGAHSLSGYSGPTFDRGSTIEDEALVHAHVLGGGGSSGEVLDGREAMRARVLDASLRRLRLEEQEIEDRCGSDGPAALK